MNPETEFRVVRRLPSGKEIELGTYAVANGATSDSVAREATYEFVKAQTVNNPAWRVIIYSPTNGGSYSAGDIIWDSAVNAAHP